MMVDGGYRNGSEEEGEESWTAVVVHISVNRCQIWPRDLGKNSMTLSRVFE